MSDKSDHIWAGLSKTNPDRDECKELVWMLCVRIGIGEAMANIIEQLINHSLEG